MLSKINLKVVGYIGLILFFYSMTVIASDKDNRVLVSLPENTQKKLLINMRDHIGALDDILHAIQSSDFDQAKTIASSRLTWSAFVHDNHNEIDKYLPIPMRKMVEKMSDDTGKFIWLAQNAAVEESTQNYQNLFKALGNITSTCRVCHETYRVR